MSSLADQLLKAGLATPEQHHQATMQQLRQAESEAGRQRSQLTSKHNRPVSLDRLQSCETIGEFKATAKDLLLEHPELMSDVITAAHRFKETDGGKKLVWIVLNVRNGLPTTTPGTRERFLNRAFRRRGATLETPTEE